MGKILIKLFYYRHSFEKNEKWEDKKKKKLSEKEKTDNGLRDICRSVHIFEQIFFTTAMLFIFYDTKNIRY